MANEKETIGLLILRAKKALLQALFTIDEQSISNKDIYEKRLVLSRKTSRNYNPRSIAFCYDADTGYYMDIDNYTWEFDKNEKALQDTASEYIQAIVEDNVEVVEKRILGITTKRELKIIESQG